MVGGENRGNFGSFDEIFSSPRFSEFARRGPSDVRGARLIARSMRAATSSARRQGSSTAGHVDTFQRKLRRGTLHVKPVQYRASTVQTLASGVTLLCSEFSIDSRNYSLAPALRAFTAYGTRSAICETVNVASGAKGKFCAPDSQRRGSATPSATRRPCRRVRPRSHSAPTRPRRASRSGRRAESPSWQSSRPCAAPSPRRQSGTCT